MLIKAIHTFSDDDDKLFLQVVLMMLEREERHHMTQLFEHLSAVESAAFTENDVQNLANKYI